MTPIGRLPPPTPDVPARPDDADPIRRSVTEPGAFALLYDRHAAAIRGYLARRLGPDLADELVAQTFLVAFDTRHRFDASRGDARPWLFGIATTLVRRHRRDEVRGYRALARAGAAQASAAADHAPAVIDGADAQVLTRRIAGALAGLPRGEREVLLLSAWGGLGHAEIAEALSVAVGTVKSRLHRARARLQPLLAGDAAGPIDHPGGTP
jgi:RNA polymerase sigma factor (sigma-70 family)